MRNPHLWIAFFSLLGVLGVAVVDLGRTAPGMLSAVHQREPDLAGRRDCSLCHGGWFSSMTEACLDCHEVVGDHIESGAGLHGSWKDARQGRCALCHSEHHGPTFTLVNRQSFAIAGVADKREFDHGLVGVAMEGRHLELTCVECHEHADAALVPAGEHRFLGLSRECATCHQDPHEGRMRQSCTNCHSQTGFDEQHFDRHEEFFPRRGRHAEAACVECHELGSPDSIETKMDGTGSRDVRACRSCHESPHRREFVKGAALLAEVRVKDSCALCHDPEHAGFRETEAPPSNAQHANSGFLLEAPHDQLDCAECHQPEITEYARRYPGRSADDCASCHGDPHGGQFEGDAFASAGCLSCHERLRFEPHSFTAQDHATAAIELSDRHGELECSSCHADPEGEAPRVFRGTPSRCEGCHEDAHRDFFRPHARELLATPEGSCATCHSTHAFRGSARADFEHQRWTDFELSGAHAQSRCESCHRRSAEPDATGRTLGHVSERFDGGRACADCHADPHQGGFDVEELPASVGGREACSRCHGETSFRSLLVPFDHTLWTSFELVGAHETLACALCHSPLADADQDGRTWRPAPGIACADCHSDPHAGQFRQEGSVDCARCHEEDTTFEDFTFLHDLDTQFPLDETHTSLDCSACHRPARVGDAEVVRYRPMGRECSDCHGVQEKVLLRKKRGKR